MISGRLRGRYGSLRTGESRRSRELRLGAPRFGATVTRYIAFIQAELVTVAEAGADEAVLAQERFTLPFASFADPIP